MQGPPPEKLDLAHRAFKRRAADSRRRRPARRLHQGVCTLPPPSAEHLAWGGSLLFLHAERVVGVLPAPVTNSRSMRPPHIALRLLRSWEESDPVVGILVMMLFIICLHMVLMQNRDELLRASRETASGGRLRFFAETAAIARGHQKAAAAALTSNNEAVAFTLAGGGAARRSNATAMIVRQERDRRKRRLRPASLDEQPASQS